MLRAIRRRLPASRLRGLVNKYRSDAAIARATGISVSTIANLRHIYGVSSYQQLETQRRGKAMLKVEDLYRKGYSRKAICQMLQLQRRDIISVLGTTCTPSATKRLSPKEIRLVLKMGRDGVSCTRIARALKISVSTVMNHLDRNHIKRKRYGVQPFSRRIIQRLYEKYRSDYLVAEHLGTHQSCVWRWRRVYGIPTINQQYRNRRAVRNT